MLESVLVYGLLTIVMVVCGIVAANREPAYVEYSGHYVKNDHFLQPEFILIIAAFAFVFGCRFGVGVDFFHYLDSYQNGAEKEMEWLFRVVSEFMSGHNIHFAVYFSVWAFLQITLLLYTFKNYRFILPYVLLYLIIGNYFMSMMNVIRQQIAALIFLNSIQFIDKKEPLKYYLSIAIALLFHRSAVVLVVFYPLFRYRDDWFRSVGVQLVLLTVAVYLSYNFDLVTRLVEKPFDLFASYLGYEETYRMGVLGNAALDDMNRFSVNTGYGVYVTLFKSVPIILLCKQLKEYYHSSFFNMMYSMWFVRVFTSYAFGNSITLSRPFVYFMDAGMVMAAFFTYYCFKSKKIGLIMLGAATVAVYLIMFLFILSNGKLNTSEYTFFWQNIY